MKNDSKSSSDEFKNEHRNIIQIMTDQEGDR